MPGFHAGPVRRATRGQGKPDGVSTQFSTPVLVRDDGSCLCDSSDIVHWVDAHYGSPETTLYPAAERAEIEAFEQSIEGKFGADTRRVAYFVVLGDPKMMQRLASENVGRVQALAFRTARPMVGALIRRGLGVQETRALRSLERVEEMFDSVSARLGDKAYFFGDRFTAADLSFACMAAPVLLPQVGYGAWLPDPATLEHQWRDRLVRLPETRAGQHALRMFAEHRPVLRMLGAA